MAYRNAVHALIRKAHQHLTKDRMGQPEMFSYINQGCFYVGGLLRNGGGYLGQFLPAPLNHHLHHRSMSMMPWVSYISSSAFKVIPFLCLKPEIKIHFLTNF